VGVDREPATARHRRGGVSRGENTGCDRVPITDFAEVSSSVQRAFRLAFFRVHRFIAGVHGAAFRPVVLLRMMLTISQVLQVFS
jgi:hypothetical protein